MITCQPLVVGVRIAGPQRFQVFRSAGSTTKDPKRPITVSLASFANVWNPPDTFLRARMDMYTEFAALVFWTMLVSEFVVVAAAPVALTAGPCWI